MISRILYIGVLATIALIFSGIQEVYAKDLKAVTNWSVSRIANPASGDPYCTLARGYEDNVVLTFAINLRDESSLGFDFQQKNLDTDRSYAIQLAAGLDLNRSFDVTPATPKALVIRLGKDKAFFEALQRAKFLGFNLNQRQFNFDFADFAEGMTQIKGCLDTFRAPQEDIATPALRAQLSQNQRTLQGFEAQIKQLESENNSLRTALGNATERARIAQQQAAKQTQIAQDAKRNTELSVAQPTVTAPSVATADTGVVTKLQTRLRDMLRDVSALKQENANLQSEVLKLSAQPQASAAPASNGYSGPQISAAEFELVKRQLNDKTNALKIAEGRITNILRDKNALASKVQMLNEKISQQERQLQLEAQATRNIPALPVSGVEARSLRTTTANVTDRVERIDQVRQEERAFQGGEVLDEVVNNPVTIRDLSTTKTQELRAQGNIVATRKDLARSRSTTARERRISDAARQKLDLANVPKARNTERLAASTARIQNLSRPSPIFDGPDEQGAEQELRAFSPSLAAANAITAGAIKSGRVSAGELSDISAPAVPVALAATNTISNSENLLPPLKPKPVQGHSYLEALLLDANIPITTELAKLDDISNQNFTAYQWDSGETFGSAEVTNTKTPDAFDVLSQAYLERTKRRCNGEFASIPTTGFQDNERLAGYDVACVSGANQGAVASLLFHIKDNKFITLAFESTAANIEKAMRVRDQLAQSIAAN